MFEEISISSLHSLTMLGDDVSVRQMQPSSIPFVFMYASKITLSSKNYPFVSILAKGYKHYAKAFFFFLNHLKVENLQMNDISISL